MKLSKSHKRQVKNTIDRMLVDIIRLELVSLRYDTELDLSEISETKSLIQILQTSIDITETKD